jgi:hypothetical protein
LECVDGCPPFTFAASAFGSALLIFRNVDERERAIGLSLFHHEGINTSLVRPEEAENISRATYDVLVELKADNFPLGMWHSMGANFVFRSLGKLCCVHDTDFTVLRACIMLERGKKVPPSANLWLPNDDIIVVRLSVINTWRLTFDHHNNDAPPPPPHPPSPHAPAPRPGQLQIWPRLSGHGALLT